MDFISLKKQQQRQRVTQSATINVIYYLERPAYSQGPGTKACEQYAQKGWNIASTICKAFSKLKWTKGIVIDVDCYSKNGYGGDY